VAEKPKPSKRPIFKIAGIAIIIIGIGVVANALTTESSTFRFNVPGQPVEFSEVSGETNFQRYGIGGLGLTLVYIGFRVFRYVPPAERERDYISEEDLDE
jgi:hypothetical protein|tara:strand:- start:795 stop:1094 length:300 start_codon:yes stop_codon:yes gene_type:complete